MAASLCGSHTLESRRKLVDRQVDKADGEELSPIVNSARISNACGNTETLVGKPRPVKSS